MPTKPRAIIFDCWNTLFFVPSNESIFMRLAAYLTKSKITYPILKTFERSLMRSPESDVNQAARTLLKDLHVPATPRTIDRVANILSSATRRHEAYDDTLRVLKELRKRGYKLALLTNTYQVALDPLRKDFKLDQYFDEIVASYDTGMIKPDPEIFKHVLDKLNVMPDEAVMVGDSLPDDVKGAESMGIKAILIDRSSRYDRHHSRIKGLKELLEIL